MKLKINLEFKFIISLIFAIVVAIFAIQNAGSVEINFLFAKFTISQAVVILGSAVVGALISILLSVIKQIKQNTTIRQLTRERDNLKEENIDLRTKLDELMITGEKEILEEEDEE
ncbi:MAG: LapA family protein [Tissierellaceae bacterium]|nr:LapA family protein [Tissierellaceae bacterium]